MFPKHPVDRLYCAVIVIAATFVVFLGLTRVVAFIQGALLR